MRGAWIEIFATSKYFCYDGSLPMRGAWIEIGYMAAQQAKNLSLPMRGAWIEMAIKSGMPNIDTSLPMRGAWIEIDHLFHLWPFGFRRSPCGERGLKYNHPFRADPRYKVAPHAGSVD